VMHQYWGYNNRKWKMDAGTKAKARFK
jgi:hypothetical protein